VQCLSLTSHEIRLPPTSLTNSVWLSVRLLYKVRGQGFQLRSWERLSITDSATILAEPSSESSIVGSRTSSLWMLVAPTFGNCPEKHQVLLTVMNISVRRGLSYSIVLLLLASWPLRGYSRPELYGSGHSILH
jgi:hypothetical protein